MTNRDIVRTFRTTEEVWDRARERAHSEGTTASSVLGDLLEGYVLGHYKLPRKKVVRVFPRLKRS